MSALSSPSFLKRKKKAELNISSLKAYLSSGSSYDTSRIIDNILCFKKTRFSAYIDTNYIWIDREESKIWTITNSLLSGFSYGYKLPYQGYSLWYTDILFEEKLYYDNWIYSRGGNFFHPLVGTKRTIIRQSDAIPIFEKINSVLDELEMLNIPARQTKKPEPEKNTGIIKTVLKYIGMS